jgi:DNA-binding response OmpR family regulator
VFTWLFEQVYTERKMNEFKVLHEMPTDQASLLEREQIIGYARGLQRMDTLLSEHIDRLRKMVENE